MREPFCQNGGYILYIDAMHEGDAPVLITVIDGMSGIVLANIKLASEKAESLKPFLRRVRQIYGAPLACVHDIGRGNLSSVAAVFPGIPDFICHFHFLRDAGKDLLEASYQSLRQRLRKHAANSRLRALAADLKRRLKNAGADLTVLAKSFTTGTVSAPAAAYSLCLWALAGKSDGDGYGFPFDCPHLGFAGRILELEERLPECKDLFQIGDWRENSAIYKLFAKVSRIAKDPELRRTVSELH